MNKLRDGTILTLGMTVVFESGREVKTDDVDFEISCLTYQGHEIPMIGRKGSGVTTSINTLYPSQEARIADQVSRLEEMKLRIDAQIEFLKQGGSPVECPDLAQA